MSRTVQLLVSIYSITVSVMEVLIGLCKHFFQRYYEKYRHHDLYITYVYKLYDLHILYNNQIEAARTLMLYANTLSVSVVSSGVLLLNFKTGCGIHRCSSLKAEIRK